MRKNSKLPVIVASIIILIAGVLVFLMLTSIRNEVNVVVAKSNIPAYSFITRENSRIEGIPKASLDKNPNILTEKEFNEKYEKSGGFVTSAALLEGQTVDKRYIPSSKNSSFSAVLPDERVVAASSSITGAAIGAIQAGDVVSVGSGGDDGGDIFGGDNDYVKVLCIATDPSGCQGVLPPGVKINAKKEDENAGSQEEGVILLLATTASSANSITGQSVNLVLNPFCGVDANGFFYSPRATGENKNNPDFQCDVDSSRMAAQNPEQIKEENSTGTEDSTSSEEGA